MVGAWWNRHEINLVGINADPVDASSILPLGARSGRHKCRPYRCINLTAGCISGDMINPTVGCALMRTAYSANAQPLTAHRTRLKIPVLVLGFNRFAHHIR